MKCYNKLGEGKFAVAKKKNGSNQNSICFLSFFSVFSPEIRSKAGFKKWMAQYGFWSSWWQWSVTNISVQKLWLDSARQVESGVWGCVTWIALCWPEAPSVILMHYLHLLPLNVTLGICLWIVCWVYVQIKGSISKVTESKVYITPKSLQLLCVQLQQLTSL